MGAGASERRLRAQVERRLEPDEELRAWTRAWVAPVRRVQWLAPRHRDFVVVTDRRLMLWASGFWTRRPRRRVLTERLDEVTISVPRGEPIARVGPPNRTPLHLELGRGPGGVAVRDALAAARTAPSGTVAS